MSERQTIGVREKVAALLRYGRESRLGWLLEPQVLVELFIVSNIAFLSLDVYTAHAVNQFAHWAEWIPFFFCVGATPVLVALMLVDGIVPKRRWVRGVGWGIGLLAVLMGIAGMVFHLEGHFFQEQTLRNLIYSAPFAAPLAFSGLGFLLMMNRMVDPDTRDWALWVILLALGGFVGNFGLSFLDHAQNGFFLWQEWIPVVGAAVTMGFLSVPFFMRVSNTYLWLCFGVLVLQVLIGLLGFYYHVHGNLMAPGENLINKFLYGAPTFAPLLFPNLAGLAMLGLWALGERRWRDTATQEEASV